MMQAKSSLLEITEVQNHTVADSSPMNDFTLHPNGVILMPGHASLFVLFVLLFLCLATTPLMAQTNERNRYYIQQMIELATNNNKLAIKDIQQMLEQTPKPTPVDAAAARQAIQQGKIALEKQQLDHSLQAFQQAYRLDASNLEAVKYLGLLYRKKGQLAEAERALQLALTLQPAEAVAWFQLAQVYGLQGDKHRATGALANTYRYAENPMRAEEILRHIAENEVNQALRGAALKTLHLYRLPAANAAHIMPIPEVGNPVP